MIPLPILGAIAAALMVFWGGCEFGGWQEEAAAQRKVAAAQKDQAKAEKELTDYRKTVSDAAVASERAAIAAKAATDQSIQEKSDEFEKRYRALAERLAAERLRNNGVRGGAVQVPGQVSRPVQVPSAAGESVPPAGGGSAAAGEVCLAVQVLERCAVDAQRVAEQTELLCALGECGVVP